MISVRAKSNSIISDLGIVYRCGEPCFAMEESKDGSYHVSATEYTYREIYDDVQTFPIEFFNHELYDFENIDDPESIRAFSQEWGIAFSPLRNSSNEFIHRAKAHGLFADDFASIDISKDINKGYYTLVSVAEVSQTLKHLKESISAILRECYTNEGNDVYLDTVYINQGITPDSIFTGTINFPILEEYNLQSHLTNQICNQLAATIKDPHEFKQCVCGKYFKKQSNDGKKIQARNPTSDSSYCCEKCRRDYHNRVEYEELRRQAQLRNMSIRAFKSSEYYKGFRESLRKANAAH